MIRGFCHAHDEDPTLFRFLLFVQHGQLSKLAPGTPTPVDAVRTVIAQRDRVEGDSRPTSGSRHGACLRDRAPAGHVCRLRPAPSRMTSMSDRLVAAAWAAVTTV